MDNLQGQKSGGAQESELHHPQSTLPVAFLPFLYPPDPQLLWKPALLSREGSHKGMLQASGLNRAQREESRLEEAWRTTGLELRAPSWILVCWGWGDARGEDVSSWTSTTATTVAAQMPLRWNGVWPAATGRGAPANRGRGGGQTRCLKYKLPNKAKLSSFFCLIS